MPLICISESGRLIYDKYILSQVEIQRQVLAPAVASPLEDQIPSLGRHAPVIARVTLHPGSCKEESSAITCIPQDPRTDQ